MFRVAALVRQPELKVTDWRYVGSDDSIRRPLRKTEYDGVVWLVDAGLVGDSLADEELTNWVFFIASNPTYVKFSMPWVDARR